MKLRSFILMAVLTLVISACNFTLAEDVTPPPGYVAPTPLPTLVLSPPQAPSVENGRLIYAEKCAVCHGEAGLGDGEQGIQLGVTVPALGLDEIARPATPAQWFTTVTRGRIDRLTPPFASLNDEERWDVTAYAMSMHITEEQAAAGKEIFETNCADCPADYFQDQKRMSAMSEIDLARIVRQGNETIPAFGKDLSDDEMWAAAAYLRSLSVDYSKEQAQAPTPTATPEAVSDTQTPALTEAGTPSGEGTPVAGTEQATAESEPTAVVKEGFGTVSGSIDNQTGKDLPPDLKITLRGFDHGGDPSAGPQEVLTQEGTVGKDGSYAFENVEMPASRIFISEVTVDGIAMQSDFSIAEEDASSVALPTITMYGMTDDSSLLVMDEVRLFLEYGDTDIQVYGCRSASRKPSTVPPCAQAAAVPRRTSKTGAALRPSPAATNCRPRHRPPPQRSRRVTPTRTSNASSARRASMSTSPTRSSPRPKAAWPDVHGPSLVRPPRPWPRPLLQRVRAPAGQAAPPVPARRLPAARATVAAVERQVKGLLFDCKMCGRCVLSSTGMSCPMNCPKQLRNGPCGGVRANGNCEVKPEMRCVWVVAWRGAERIPGGLNAIQQLQPPVDRRLEGTSAWLRVVREKHGGQA